MSNGYRPNTAIKRAQQEYAEMDALCKQFSDDETWIKDNRKEVNSMLGHDIHKELTYDNNVIAFSPEDMNHKRSDTGSFDSFSDIDNDRRLYDCSKYMLKGNRCSNLKHSDVCIYLHPTLIAALEALTEKQREIVIQTIIFEVPPSVLAKEKGCTSRNILKTKKQAIMNLKANKFIVDTRGSDTTEKVGLVALLVAMVLACHYFFQQYLLPRNSWLAYIGYAGLSVAAIICGLLFQRQSAKEIEALLRQSRTPPNPPCESVPTQPPTESSKET